MTKLYALAHAHQVGLFHDWNVAGPLTKGYPDARHRSFDNPQEAYRFAYGRPWPGGDHPLVVCHPDGWAALVDVEGDVAAQVTEGAPRPGPPVVAADAVTVVYEGRTVERPVDNWLAVELDRLDLLP